MAHIRPIKAYTSDELIEITNRLKPQILNLESVTGICAATTLSTPNYTHISVSMISRDTETEEKIHDILKGIPHAIVFGLVPDSGKGMRLIDLLGEEQR